MRELETDSLVVSLLGVDKLKTGKNLLAFSAGSDSTALFFLLLERSISFDIAIVNYNLRPQSKKEVAYAKKLAQKYGKKAYVKEAPLCGSNIEARARQIRYQFFEEIAKKQGYTNLITAHHLDDLAEWFFMQFTKGAGIAELVGMEPIQPREHYTLVRPLLLTPKKVIEAYLKERQIKYFIDESNFDTTFQRNLFRHRFVKELMEYFSEGIAKSFGYLLEDKKLLEPHIVSIKELYLANVGRSDYETQRILDRLFKKAGYLLSSSQKEEILRQKVGTIASKIAFAIENGLIWIAPAKNVNIPKKIREEYRRAKVPVPIRPYLYEAKIDLETIALYRPEVQR